MRFLVNFELEPTYVGGPDMGPLNESAVSFFRSVGSDPRFESSGHWADGRGGFMVVNVGSEQELMQIIAPFIMHVRFTTHPLVSLADAANLIAEMGAKFAGH